MQPEAPTKLQKPEKSNRTLQTVGLGMGPDRQRSELGLLTGTNPELLTKGISVDIMTPPPDIPQTVTARQKEEDSREVERKTVG